jgi:hypothetical protein
MKMKNIMSYLPKDTTQLYIVTIIAMYIVYKLLQIIAVFATSFEKEIEVREKYVKPGKKTEFSVIDSEGNTYLIVDRFILMEFNSGDDYAMMKVGGKYKVKGYWFRFPLLSWYPQLYAVEKV